MRFADVCNLNDTLYHLNQETPLKPRYTHKESAPIQMRSNVMRSYPNGVRSEWLLSDVFHKLGIFIHILSLSYHRARVAEYKF